MLKNRTGALQPRADMYYVFPEPVPEDPGLRGQQRFTMLSEHSSSSWHVRGVCPHSSLMVHGCTTVNGNQLFHDTSHRQV